MTQIGFDLESEPADEREPIEPIVLRFEQHHAFVPPLKKPKSGNGKCQTCKRRDGWIEHLGFPAPLENDCGDDPYVWQSNKKMWQASFGEQLHASGLPRGVIERVMVHVRYTFGDRQRRDRDNLVYPLCKYLGDTLVRGRFTQIAYEAIDWTDSGMIGKRKTHRRLIAGLVHDFGLEGFGGAVHISSQKNELGKPVTVVDPLGGWIPDDRWDRFEVVTFEAVYEKDVYASELMLMCDTVPPPPWPPNAE